MLIQIIAMRVRGKIGLTYHSGKMSKVCSKPIKSRILLFYIHHSVDDNGEQSDEIRALVQTCNYQVGSDHARWLHMQETHLCSR
jgi:hypothetical protein